MNKINKIIVTGDILRCNKDGIENQNINIKWFYLLFSYFLKNSVKNIPFEVLYNNPIEKFNMKTFYNLNNMKPNLEYWIKIFDEKFGCVCISQRSMVSVP